MVLVQDVVLHGRLATSQGGAVIPDGSVTTDKIANLAVTTAKLAQGAVTEGKLASNAVTTGKLATGAVTGAKIATGAVTADKLDIDMTYTVTDGDLTISFT